MKFTRRQFSLGSLILVILLACNPIPNPGGSGDPGNVNDGSCTASTALTVKNKPYGTDTRQKADMFLPASRTCSTPAVILVTGGIWAYSDRNCTRNEFVIRMKKYFTQRGYAVITMDYRYATGQPADQVNDLKQCVDSVTAWANRYVFSDRIHIIGESSGAYLALMYALQYQNPKTPSIVAVSPIMDFADTALIRINSGLHILKFTDASCGYWIAPVDSSDLTLFDLLCDYMGSPHFPNHDLNKLGAPCFNPLSIVGSYPLACSGVTKYPGAKIPAIQLIHGVTDELVPPRQSVMTDSLFSVNAAFTMPHQLSFLPYAHGYLSASTPIQMQIDSVAFQWVSSF